jgi:hypothetical protein
LPTQSASRAPRAPSRAASAGVCASTGEKADTISRAKPGAQRRQRRAERSDSRAFTSASGTPRRRAARIRFGHSSDSTKAPASGRQPAKKRSAQRGTSSGAKR